mgnify:FL=1
MVNLPFNLSILECKLYPQHSHDVRGASFNLSILECKSGRQATSFDRTGSFNLSILECKFLLGDISDVRHLLLISPYWNVKQA